MNKDKISNKILNNVSILSDNKTKVLVVTNDFNKSKQFLDKNKYDFKSFRFANCFSMEADLVDIDILSNQDEINFIYLDDLVTSESLQSDFIHIDTLQEGKFFGQGQTICFIDTGIHPHLDFDLPRPRIIKFIDLINKKSHPYDDNGHGTFISGISSSNGILDKGLSGIAPQANIISIKALKENGSSDSNVILDAMQWIYENHKAYNISVVCMSFGADIIEQNDPLSLGAEALWRRNIIVVAAAGNSGPKSGSIKSPGSNPNIITVGGLDVSSLSVADFSSRGPTIFGHKPDLIAPAVNLKSCNNLRSPYTIMSGTSVATPIIAGICAVIKSKYPKMTNVEVKKFLLAHCKKLTGNIDFEGAGFIQF